MDEGRSSGNARLWQQWSLYALALPSAVVAILLMRQRRLAYLDGQRRLKVATALLDRRNAQLNALSNVFSQITDDLAVGRVIHATLSETMKFMDADMVTIRSLDREQLVSIGSIGRDGKEFLNLAHIPLGQGQIGRAALERRVLKFDRDAELSMRPLDPDGTKKPSVQMKSAPMESGIIVPLVVGSKLTGTLACWSRRMSAFNEEDQRTLELMASQIATALAAASTVEETVKQAHQDSLTGMPNRLKLHEDLRGPLRELAGAGRRAVFAMVDIDRFKEFNDRLGHGAGDAILQEVASVLGDCMRETDCYYRYGGEEFVLVFHDVSMDEAYTLAERLRLAVIARQDASAGLTISLGLASLPEHGTDPRALVELADAAMYQAKRAGRNRTVMWNGAAEAAA